MNLAKRVLPAFSENLKDVVTQDFPGATPQTPPASSVGCRWLMHGGKQESVAFLFRIRNVMAPQAQNS